MYISNLFNFRRLAKRDGRTNNNKYKNALNRISAQPLFLGRLSKPSFAETDNSDEENQDENGNGNSRNNIARESITYLDRIRESSTEN